MNDYRVRVQMVADRHWNVKVIEKVFKTEALRTQWLMRNDDKIANVLSYSDPQ